MPPNTALSLRYLLVELSSTLQAALLPQAQVIATEAGFDRFAE